MSLPAKIERDWREKGPLAQNARLYLLAMSGRVPKTSTPITRSKHGVADTLQLQAAGVARRMARHEECQRQAKAAKARRDEERAARRQAQTADA